jgi:HSP20 family molecular chaperone IbpA
MSARWNPLKTLGRVFEPGFPFLPMVPAAKLFWELPADLYEDNEKIVAEMNLPGDDPELIERTINLPFQANTEKVEAQHKNGDLEIAMPIMEKTIPTEKVNVQIQ